MYFAATRFASGLIVLLACTMAMWRGHDRTPSRTVVELVSVVYVPARADTKPAGAKPAGEPAIVRIAEPPPAAPPVIAVQPAPPKRALQVSAAAPVKHAAVAKAACRRTACGATSTTTHAIAKRVDARQPPKAEQPVPTVFVPLRNLGLRLQAKLGGAPRDNQVAPRKAGAKPRPSNA